MTNKIISIFFSRNVDARKEKFNSTDFFKKCCGTQPRKISSLKLLIELIYLLSIIAVIHGKIRPSVAQRQIYKFFFRMPERKGNSIE